MEVNMWSRLINGFTEWLRNTLEDYEGIEWDDLALKMSWITAGMLNGAFIAIKFAGQTGMGKFDNGLVEIGLIAISCINTLALFMARKTYRMFNHDKRSRPISQNVRLVDKNQVVQWTCTGLGACLALAVQYVFKSAKQSEEDLVWEVSMWNPSFFTLNLFM
ncbi:10654_t:CDS:2 [Paraglomus brasilianum]|uniref:10654_t:CDS:1 n=1 Tax=Paraglomus brasilianum TaxID=144538 RepID=A0A9N9A2F6_9GLOM|nr:10654_t:CDS:2 [Paraglomus brasilianum]